MDETIYNKIINSLEQVNQNLNPPWFQNLSFWNLIILFFTLIAIVLYTKYTYKILKENTCLRESSFMPFLYILQTDFNLANQPNNISFNGNVNLVNIGKGPAIDIKIDDINVGYFLIKYKKPKQLIPPKNDFSSLHDFSEEIIPSGKKTYEKLIAKQTKILKISCKDQLGGKYCFKYDISNLNQPPSYLGYNKF